MKKRLLLLFAAIVLVLSACSGKAPTSNEGKKEGSNEPAEQVATNFPEKDIEIVVPFPPGGTTDTTMRIIAGVLPNYLPNKVNVVVVNKPGGTGVVGSTAVSKEKADGYTLLYSTIPTITYSELFGTASYSYKDFTPIVNVQVSQSMLMVKADAPWNSFEELLDYIKNNPGKFTYGTPGIGSSQHLTMEALNIEAGLETTMVPFDGTASALTSLLGGHINAAIIQAHEATEYVANGDLKPLVHLGNNKYEGFADVPLLDDFGYERVLSDPSSGVFGPKDMPEDVAQILYEAFTKSFEDPKVVEFYEGLKLKPDGTGLREFEELLLKNYTIAKEVIEKNNLGPK